MWYLIVSIPDLCTLICFVFRYKIKMKNGVLLNCLLTIDLYKTSRSILLKNLIKTSHKAMVGILSIKIKVVFSRLREKAELLALVCDVYL